MNVIDSSAESSDVQDGSDSDSWVSEFLQNTGHDLFAEVPDDYTLDDFNLTGLSALVPSYEEALDLILDVEISASSEPLRNIERSAEILYGLIHARFITTRLGLSVMAMKYNYGKFGKCPRVMCRDTRVIPVGLHDLPGYEPVRFYCPCCRDIYDGQSTRFLNVDGAYFGTSYLGLLMQTYPTIELECEEKRNKIFQLTIYGFNIAESSISGPRMKWLRMEPKGQEELQKEDTSMAEETDKADNASSLSFSATGDI